ncbi:nucleotidyltransferase family protein [Dyella jejuensis]
MTQVSHALGEAIAASVPALHAYCRDPWVVVGSAAAALAGAAVEVADVDVLASSADAERLMALWQSLRDTRFVPAGAERFRSRFARFHFPGLPVEVMGDLQLRGSQGWQPVQVKEIVQVAVAGVPVPIPARGEQIRMLESFGRPKDLLRIQRLRAL